MDRAGAASFVYAKACGMYARSFVGSRAKKLFEAKRLQDLWSLLFKEEVPLVPEGMLALLLERKSEEYAVRDFITLVSVYDKPDPVSLALLSLYDYNNLKAASSSILLGKTERPFMVDIGEFAMFDASLWPDLAGMTQNTPVSWYNRVPDPTELIEWETRLDHEYYRSLWFSLQSLKGEDRISTEKLIREEIILQNIIWTMRLRVYYEKTGDEILPMLAGNNDGKAVAKILCEPAQAIFEKSVDSWKDWSTWKYSWLLNPHEEGVPWTVDPRWAQLSADTYLYNLALKEFHQHPFTIGVLVSFFKIKQLEEHLIRVAAEGLRLGVSENQMREFLGDSQNV